MATILCTISNIGSGFTGHGRQGFVRAIASRVRVARGIFRSVRQGALRATGLLVDAAAWAFMPMAPARLTVRTQTCRAYRKPCEAGSATRRSWRPRSVSQR